MKEPSRRLSPSLTNKSLTHINCGDLKLWKVESFQIEFIRVQVTCVPRCRTINHHQTNKDVSFCISNGAVSCWTIFMNSAQWNNLGGRKFTRNESVRFSSAGLLSPATQISPIFLDRAPEKAISSYRACWQGNQLVDEGCLILTRDGSCCSYWLDLPTDWLVFRGAQLDGQQKLSVVCLLVEFGTRERDIGFVSSCRLIWPAAGRST